MATNGVTIATAAVQLIPSFKGGEAAIRASLNARAVGELAGRDLAEGLTAGLRAPLEAVGASAGTTAGEQAGLGFREGFTAPVEEASAQAKASIVGVGEAGKVAGEEAGAGFGEFAAHIKELAKTFVEILAVEKVVEFGKESIEAGENVERTSSLIEAQIKATGDAAHVTAEAVQEIATSVSDSSGVARAQILLAEQGLLRFANVANHPGEGNDIFTRTSADAADLAAVMHTDVPSAAALLGKALNNPTVGLTRLTRAGVSFTSQQTAQIKALTESGNLLAAQRVILGRFESQFSGAAAAAATPLDRLKASGSNLEASLGQALLPVIDAGITKLADLGTAASDAAQGGLTEIGDAFSALEHNDNFDLEKALGVGPDSPVISGLDELKEVTEGTFGAVKDDLAALRPGAEAFGKALAEAGLVAGGALLSGIGKLANALHPVVVAVSGFLTEVAGHQHALDAFVVALVAGAVAFKATVVLLGAYNAVMGLVRGAQLAFRDAVVSTDLALDANPVGVVVGGLVALGAGIYALTRRSEESKPVIESYFDLLSQSGGKLDAAIRSQAAQNIVSDGAGDAAQTLGIKLSLVTDAALGNQKAFGQLKAVGAGLVTTYNDVVNSNDGLVASGKLTEAQAQQRTKTAQANIDAYNKLIGVVDASTGQLAKDRREQQQVSAATADTTEKVKAQTVARTDGADKVAAAEGGVTRAQQGLKTATQELNTANAALHTGLSQIDTDLSALETQYFGLSDAADAFQSSLNSIKTAAQAAKGQIDGTSDANIAYRKSIEDSTGAIAAAVEQDVKHHKSSADTLADFYSRRASLTAELKQLGLSQAQIKTYTDALAHVPGELKTKVTIPTADDKQAKDAVKASQKTLDAAKANVVNVSIKYGTPGEKAAAEAVKEFTTRAQHIPKEVNLAFYAQGTKNAILGIQSVSDAVNAIPTDIKISVAASKAKGTLPGLPRAAFATGGPVYGPGTGTSDSVDVRASTGEFIVNAASTARHRAQLERINSDPGYAAGGTVAAPAAPATHIVNTRVFLGTRELEDLVRTEIDQDHLEVAGYLRSHGGR